MALAAVETIVIGALYLDAACAASRGHQAMCVSDYLSRIETIVSGSEEAKLELENIWSEVQDLFLNDSLCYLTLDEVLRVHTHLASLGYEMSVSQRIKSVDFVYVRLWEMISR